MKRLQHWLTEQAERRPDARALVDADASVSFSRLEADANRLAHALRDAGCARGDRVCVFAPKSPAALTAVLAVLKADAVFVPVDVQSPAARLARIAAACEFRLILATSAAAGRLDELRAALGDGRTPPVGWLDEPGAAGAELGRAFTGGEVSQRPCEPPASRGAPSDAALILFTSGSTGEPKGVVIRHDSVAQVTSWAVGYFGIDATDRLSLHAPLFFDIAYLDLFAGLAAGAELHLVPRALNLLPHKLAEFIRARELTQWFSVPSVLAHMAHHDVVRPGDFPALRRVLWAGEVFRTPALRRWMKRLPHVRFTNLYGPTETTIVSSFHTLPECPPDDRAEVPIGRACDGERLLVLDEHLRPTPSGAVGELYIGGAGLSEGYWRDEPRTRAAFVRDPTDARERLYRTGDLARVDADGLVYFCGRSDTQIKSRGYRIELGEIESALAALPELRESAVVAVESAGFEGRVVCCAFAPRDGADATPARLRARLAEWIPGYMIPVRWMRCDELPRTPSGKVDRVRLQESFLRDDPAPPDR